jgi:hypothetical protein
MLLKIKRVHFAKMTDFMEQKFGTAVAISECLIHTAYSNRLSPGALQHEALVQIVKYVNDVATNSNLLSFIHKPSDLFLVETSYIYKQTKNFRSGSSRPVGYTSQLNANLQIYSLTGLLQLYKQSHHHS